MTLITTPPFPSPLYAGNIFTTTVTFSVPNGEGQSELTDPSTITLKFRVGGGATTTWVYQGTGGIEKVSTGVYTADIDTTGLPGAWTVEWVGTGTCAAVSITQLTVQKLPL